MELLVINGVGAAVEVRENGRLYLRAPSVLIVEGVLPGSKGNLFYPSDEIRNSAATWNGTLITLRHPTDPTTGQHLSAKSPGVADRLGMGVLRNAHFNGSLRADMWFDVAKTERLDQTLNVTDRVLPRLRQGKPIELSTGLFTRNDPAPLGATWNGRSYTHIARNYRPDHLAVLPTEQGACSLRDGCGVLVNSRSDDMFPDLFGVLNCGGKGGKPGPCPSGGHDVPHFPGTLYPGRTHYSGDPEDTDKMFPHEVTHGGRRYFATGKKGKNIKTGKHVREYEDDKAGRMWRDAKGTIYPD